METELERLGPPASMPEGASGCAPARRSSTRARAVVVPAVRRVAERAALGPDHAKPLPGRRFHHPPPLQVLDTARSERLPPARLGLLIVRLYVEVDPAFVVHRLYEEERFVGTRRKLAVGRVLGVRRLHLSAERGAPESRRAFHVVAAAVDHEGAEAALVHVVLACEDGCVPREGKFMSLEFAEEVAILRMDFGKANAIGDAFLQKMSALLEEVAARKARALVLTGDGRTFCAGLDLPALLDRGAEEIGAFVDRFSTFMLRVFELPIPVVAAIDGHAVAGGCVLALQTDFRVMSAGTIGLNEVRIGVALPAVVLETLRLQVSPSSLRTIALEGRLFEPDAALHIGLVDEVVGPDRLIPRALEKAREMAALPAVSFARIKHSLRAPVAEAARRAAETDKKAWASGFASPEAQAILREVV